MWLFDAIMQSLRDLRGEWKRLGLVALGVAWGTLSMTLLVAFGEGMATGVQGTIGNFGVDLLRIGGGTRSVSFEGLPAGGRIALQPEDEKRVLVGVPQARGVALEYSGGSRRSLRLQDAQVNVPLSGSGPEFLRLRSMRPVAGGRFLNDADVSMHRHVCFLGGRTKRRLFGNSNAVGAEVQLLGRPFTVIGVRQDLVGYSNYNGADQDKVTIPHTVFKDLLGWDRISFLMVGLKPEANKDAALAAIYSVLGSHHGFDPSDAEALSVGDYIETQEMILGMLNHRHFNSLIGFFGLLVAILGVMNVMYAMVEERTREIGVCVAVGASPSDIIRDRLLESLLVTLLGGAVGLTACAAFLAAMNWIPLGSDARAYIGHPALSLGLGAGVVGILCLAGFAAGWYPARRASLLNPIEALRDE